MSKPDADNLEHLFLRVKQGDGAALQLLCKELQHVIREVFQRKFQDSALIDDLCQETFVRFLGNINHVKEPSKLKGFACKVAFHVLQDHFRRKYRNQEEAISLHDIMVKDGAETRPHTEPHDAGSSDDLIRELDLEDAMNKLSSKSREIMVLKSQGFSYDEIAREMSLSVSGVKMQVKRSLEFLRSILVSVTFVTCITTLIMKAI